MQLRLVGPDVLDRISSQDPQPELSQPDPISQGLGVCLQPYV